jgi:hypothetical protein
MTIEDKSYKVEPRDDIVYVCPGCHMSRVCVLEAGMVRPLLKVISQEEAMAMVLGGALRMSMDCGECQYRRLVYPTDTVIV